MARIADISLDELGKKIFSASVEGKTAKELLYTDYKEFHIAGHDPAVAQITCVDSKSMLVRKEELLTEMKAIAREKGVSLIILMLTDVLKKGTHILYIGDDDVISQAFGVTPKENEVFLPKIMSKKANYPQSVCTLGLRESFCVYLETDSLFLFEFRSDIIMSTKVRKTPGSG